MSQDACVRFTLGIALSAVFLLSAGCGDSGPPLGKVTGQVTLDGKPLEGALVQFSPDAGGRGSFAATDASGRYELIFNADNKGALVGKHSVTITTASEEEYNEETEETTPAREEILPDRYHENTELTADDTGGGNTIDFPLPSD